MASYLDIHAKYDLFIQFFHIQKSMTELTEARGSVSLRKKSTSIPEPRTILLDLITEICELPIKTPLLNRIK